MDPREYLSKRLYKLYSELKELNIALNDFSLEKYKRVNPFMENIINWKEKGAYITGKKSVTIYDSTTIVGDVTIGENTWIGPFCSIDGTAGITIGKGCSISAHCCILTHDTVKWAVSDGISAYEFAPTSIGDNCFLGVKCTILKGVKIGNRCVVGANSVVNKDVPDNAIVAGNPAVIIGEVFVNNGVVELQYFHKCDGK